MRVLDWSSMTTYEPPMEGGNLLVAEWRTGSCRLDAATVETTTDVRSVTAVFTATSARDVITSELIDLEPSQVSRTFLLCSDAAAQLFQQSRHELHMNIGSQAEILWIAHGHYYFRHEGSLVTGAVNLITGDVVAGFERTLQRFPLTAMPQGPIVKPEITLEDGMRIAVRKCTSMSNEDPATLDMVLIHQAQHTVHSSLGQRVRKKEISAHSTGAQSLDLGATHLAGAAYVYTPILTYTVVPEGSTLIYDPLVGRLYKSR